VKNLENLSLKFPGLLESGLFFFLLLESIIVFSIFLPGCKIPLLLFPSLIFLVLNFWDVRIGLFVMIALASSAAYGVKSVSGIMLVVLGLISVFVCLTVYFRSCLQKFKINKSELNWPIAVFLGIVLFHLARGFLNSYPLKWIYFESLAYLGFGVVFLVINLCDNEAVINKFFRLLIFLAYFQAILGLVNYFKVGHRVGGYLFGAYPSLIALVLLNMAFYSRNKLQRLIYLLLSLPLILHLLFSFTRGYWLGFLVALLISFSIYTINSKSIFSKKVFVFFKGLFLLFVGIIVLLTLAAHFFPVNDLYSKVGIRFISSFSAKPTALTASNYARLVEYKVCWEAIKQKPIFGHGIGYALTIKQPILQSQGMQWFVHQSYLMIALKMGLIGLLGFFWMFYTFFRFGFRSSKSIENSYYQGMSFGFIANAIQLLVIALTNYDFASVVNTFYLGFAMGGVVIINSKGIKIVRNTFT